MGVDPSGEVSPQDYDKARQAIRSIPELVADGSKMARARVEHRLKIMQVSEEQAAQNIETCRENRCGSYGRLATGVEVCHRCNCMGKDLHNKTRRRGERCPADLWSNK